MSGRPSGEAATTYVLVHGGGSTGRFWDRLLPHLDGPSVAVDLPGRGAKPADLGSLTVDDEVESVLGDIDAAGVVGRVVLVAHSSGGLVVPGVVVGLRARGIEVAHVVLSAASVPPEGGCGLDCMQARHRDGLVASIEAARRDGTTITTPGPPPDPEAFRTAYGGEPLDDETLRYVVDPCRVVRDTVHHYFQPVHWSLAAGVPVTYVLNLHDRPVPGALQEEMAARLPGSPSTVRLACGHIPAVTISERFAAIVRSVASA